MNLLHISDMHFGTRHWTGSQEQLLNKLNTYSADLVLNTGDSTTDSLENEFIDAGNFLKALNSPHVVTIVGNHDKRNMRSQDFFKKYIDVVELIRPLDNESCKKPKIFLGEFTTGIEEKFTDCNFVKPIAVDGEITLVVGLDTTEILQDNGIVDEEILSAVSRKIETFSYDNIILLYHHSVIETDSDPLFNSERIIKFIHKHRIQYTFCGHTHRLSIVKTTDVLHKHSFTQFKNGSLSSCNTPDDTNMFLFYENFGADNMKVHVVRIFIVENGLRFEEEILTDL